VPSNIDVKPRWSCQFASVGVDEGTAGRANGQAWIESGPHVAIAQDLDRVLRRHELGPAYADHGGARVPARVAARASLPKPNPAAPPTTIAGVSFDDWMLALHVLSAFALVAGVIFFWVLIFAARRTDTPEGTLRFGPLTRLADAAIAVGMGGTIVLGLWLAFSVGDYEIWDGWIIAAIVLWLIAAQLGQRTGAAYGASVRKAQELRAAGQTGPNAELLALNRTSTGVLLQLLVSIVVLLIIIDMIWKPGA
jgi:uncharacterized membrane protein